MQVCPITHCDCVAIDCKWVVAAEPENANCVVFEILRQLHKTQALLLVINNLLIKIAQAKQ